MVARRSQVHQYQTSIIWTFSWLVLTSLHDKSSHRVTSPSQLQKNIPPKFWLQIFLYALWVDWGAGFSTSTCALNAGRLHNRVSGGAGASSRRSRDSDTLSRYNWGADSNKTGEQNLMLKAGYIGIGSRFHNHAQINFSHSSKLADSSNFKIQP